MGGACLERAGDDAAPEHADDWYANLIEVGRRRCVLFTHVATLFPVVAVGLSAAKMRELSPVLRDGYASALTELGIGRARIAAELLRLGDPQLARTCNRSVLGSMNEYAFRVAAILHADGASAPDAGLRIGLEIATMPMSALGDATALDAVRARLD